jgi:hypothetical protein
MRYLEIYTLSQNQPLQTAAAGVCLKFANDIRNEDAQTPNHANRMIWAARPPMHNAGQMVFPIALNATVQTKWVDRAELSEQLRFDDSDIEFVIASNIDRFATG